MLDYKISDDHSYGEAIISSSKRQSDVRVRVYGDPTDIDHYFHSINIVDLKDIKLESNEKENLIRELREKIANDYKLEVTHQIDRYHDFLNSSDVFEYTPMQKYFAKVKDIHDFTNKSLILQAKESNYLTRIDPNKDLVIEIELLNRSAKSDLLEIELSFTEQNPILNSMITPSLFTFRAIPMTRTLRPGSRKIHYKTVGVNSNFAWAKSTATAPNPDLYLYKSSRLVCKSLKADRQQDEVQGEDQREGSWSLTVFNNSNTTAQYTLSMGWYELS